MIVLCFSTSCFTKLLDSSTNGERGDAGRITESHLRRRGCAYALRQMEKGSGDWFDAGRQPTSRQECPDAGGHQRVRQLHVHGRQRSWCNWRDYDGESSMFVSISFRIPWNPFFNLDSVNLLWIAFSGSRYRQLWGEPINHALHSPDNRLIDQQIRPCIIIVTTAVKQFSIDNEGKNLHKYF